MGERPNLHRDVGLFATGDCSQSGCVLPRTELTEEFGLEYRVLGLPIRVAKGEVG